MLLTGTVKRGQESLQMAGKVPPSWWPAAFIGQQPPAAGEEGPAVVVSGQVVSKRVCSKTIGFLTMLGHVSAATLAAPESAPLELVQVVLRAAELGVGQIKAATQQVQAGSRATAAGTIYTTSKGEVSILLSSREALVPNERLPGDPPVGQLLEIGKMRAARLIATTTAALTRGGVGTKVSPNGVVSASIGMPPAALAAICKH